MGYVKKTDAKKAWTKKVSFKRTSEIVKNIKNTFLIFCEGGNTEPIYFESFPVNSETKIEALGLGMSRTALVNRIIEIASEREVLKDQRKFDPDRQIWCVFDRDIKGNEGEDNDFNNAILIATNAGLKVAYSNDSFELWFVLHDKYLEVQHTRKQYYAYLSKKFGINYEKEGKGEGFSRTLYDYFLQNQPKAIRNAKKLHNKYADCKKFCTHHPCTTVYELVIELNKCLKS